MSPRVNDLSTETILTLLAKQSVDEVMEAFAPAPAPSLLDPPDEIKKGLAILAGGSGRPIIDWIFAITCNAPYPQSRGDNLNELAIAAAKHQSRAAIGDIIGKAILAGRILLEQKKVSHEKPD